MTSRRNSVSGVVDFVLSEVFDDTQRSSLADQLADQISPKSLPQPDQTTAVSWYCPKTAALFHDRVWCPYRGAPESVGFFCDTEIEAELFTFFQLQRISVHVAEQLKGDGEVKDLAKELFMRSRTMLSLASYSEGDPPLTDEHLLTLYRSVEQTDTAFHRKAADAVMGLLDTRPTSVFSSTAARDSEYSSGDRSVLVAAIEGLSVPSEDDLSWEQVLQFRGDQEARVKARRFVHWLDDEMLGRDASFVRDEISQRLEDYTWALDRHGIKTVNSVLSAMLDSRALISSAVAGCVLTASGRGIAGLLVAGGLLVGRAVLAVSESYVNLRDVEHGPGSEVAYVYEMKEHLGSS